MAPGHCEFTMFLRVFSLGQKSFRRARLNFSINSSVTIKVQLADKYLSLSASFYCIKDRKKSKGEIVHNQKTRIVARVF